MSPKLRSEKKKIHSVTFRQGISLDIVMFHFSLSCLGGTDALYLFRYFVLDLIFYPQEAKVFKELVLSSTAKGLVHVFFSQRATAKVILLITCFQFHELYFIVYLFPLPIVFF